MALPRRTRAWDGEPRSHGFPAAPERPCPGSALPDLSTLAAPLLPSGVLSKSHALEINGRQLWQRGNNSTWNHKTCVPVLPLPRAELGAHGPVSSLEKGSDNCRDVELLKAPPSRACDAQGILSSNLKWRGAGVEGGVPLPAPAQTLFPRAGTGPPLGLPEPCSMLGHTGAPLHRKPVCVETFLWPGFTVEPGS